MSFIVQKFISDGMTAGKSDIFLRNIFLGFLSLKKLTHGSISSLLFILLQKNLLPYQILFVKRGNKKISKSVAISLQRQLVLSKKLYITLLREIKFESLAGRIPRQFFELFRGNTAVISRHLKKRYGE